MSAILKLLVLAVVALAVVCAAPTGELEAGAETEPKAAGAAEAAPDADLQGSDSILEKHFKKQLKHGGFGYGYGMPFGGFGFPGYGMGFPPMGLGMSPLYGGLGGYGLGGYGLGGYGLGGYGLGGYGLGGYGFGGYPLGFGF